MPKIATDHYARRMKIAERAAKLAKRLDKLALEADLIILHAQKGETDEGKDRGSFSGGWQPLTSDFAANSLSRAASDLRRAARDAGFMGSV